MLRLVRARDVPALTTLLRTHINPTRQSYLEALDRPDSQGDAKASVAH